MKKSKFCSNVICYSFCTILFAGVLLMIVLLSITIQTVEQTEYAVGYDNYTMEFTKVYTQGRYTTRVGEYLIKLPRTLQEFDIKLTCLTNDKVLVQLDVAMQYQYDPTKLIDIVLVKFDNKNRFNTFIKNRATSSIMNTCLNYKAEDYYTKRGEIDISIYNMLTSVINDQSIGANVEFFQLVNINFPQSFSDVIEKKQTVQQEALTATNDRQSILTNAQTRLKEAERTSLITLINSNNTALIILNKAIADASAQEELWSKRAYAYGYTANLLNLNGSSMIDYINNENVQQSNTLVTTVN